jgi:hypothetical protein
VRSRHSEFGHSIKDVERKSSLDRLPIPVARVQPIAKDPLVTEERVLGASLTMVARLLLPLPSTNLANTSSRAIPRSTSTTTGLGSLDWRHDDLRASARSCVIQRATIVCTVADDPVKLAWHATHKINANAGHRRSRLSALMFVLVAAHAMSHS